MDMRERCFSIRRRVACLDGKSKGMEIVGEVIDTATHALAPVRDLTRDSLTVFRLRRGPISLSRLPFCSPLACCTWCSPCSTTENRRPSNRSHGRCATSFPRPSLSRRPSPSVAPNTTPQLNPDGDPHSLTNATARLASCVVWVVPLAGSAIKGELVWLSRIQELQRTRRSGRARRELEASRERRGRVESPRRRGGGGV